MNAKLYFNFIHSINSIPHALRAYVINSRVAYRIPMHCVFRLLFIYYISCLSSKMCWKLSNTNWTQVSTCKFRTYSNIQHSDSQWHVGTNETKTSQCFSRYLFMRPIQTTHDLLCVPQSSADSQWTNDFFLFSLVNPVLLTADVRTMRIKHTHYAYDQEAYEKWFSVPCLQKAE